MCKITGATSLRLHFLPYARFFRSSKGWGGGHGPRGPIVNTPLDLHTLIHQSMDQSVAAISRCTSVFTVVVAGLM